MNDVKKLLARIGTARDAISRKEEQTSLDFMIDGVLMNCAVMLKEQEAVEPLPPETELGTLWRCGSCGREIGYKYHFCQWCGKKVKWE